MSIYMNVGWQPRDGRKPRKHIRGDCPDLLEVGERGHPVKYARNTDRSRPAGEQRWERCPRCFRDLHVITAIGEPAFLKEARRRQLSRAPGRSFVYNLNDPVRRDSQVGKADDAYDRLKHRWRATCAGDYVEGCIPWLNVRLQKNVDYEPELEIIECATSAGALVEERVVRDRLRSHGWFVSSSV